MQPILTTTNGRVRGETVGTTHVFRGIRYAASTAGPNRFLLPQPCQRWSGAIEAVSWPPSAPQTATKGYDQPFYAWNAATEPQSEDCLFLNVCTPGLGDGRRPVMVWLHGGGWRSFASSAPGCDATRLAAAQDVVVVSVNHRLNLFGYLPVDETVDERFRDAGQAGLLDLVAALRWVRDNAEAIGGDPGNVTIFGQSGGAAKTAALMAMPAAQGLFHKAIVQSTSGGLRLMGRPEARQAAALLATAAGAATLDPAALQALPVSALLRAADTVPNPFRPVVDGSNCPMDPFHPEAPALSADVPLLVGTTHTETTWYYPQAPGMFAIGFSDALLSIGRFLGVDEAAASRIVEAYRAADPAADATDVVTAVTTDYLFKRNTFRIADLKAGQGRAAVFGYVFSRESNAVNGRIRSPHSAEIPFIFGTTDTAVAHCGTGPDIGPMTDVMMATWASFARTGHPGNPLVPSWPPYELEGRATMILNVESRLAGDPLVLGRELLREVPLYEYSNSRQSFLLKA